MYISWWFNSVVFMLTNFLVTLYYGQRFFRIMRNHYRLVAEITEFNTLVGESRLNLDYTTAKISEAMKEIEIDIGEELNITHNLTILNERMTSLLAHFTTIEEEVIEVVRTNYNMKSITITTPNDINSEVNKILRRKKKLLESSKNKITNDATAKCFMRSNDCSIIG